MRIADIVNDSIVDGPGLRFTVFVQGCSRNCPGCHNPHTHDPKGGREETLENIISMFDKNILVEGITISGGEPFDQASACAKLAWLVHRRGRTVWTYTGYTYEQILQAVNPDWYRLLAETDVLVDGPFIENCKSYELHFRGSKNQRLIDVQKTLRSGNIVLWEEKADSLSKFVVPES